MVIHYQMSKHLVSQVFCQQVNYEDFTPIKPVDVPRKIRHFPSQNVCFSVTV